MAFNTKTIREIARLTENNQHTEALILGAQMLEYKHLLKKLQLVGELHRLEGHMPTGLGKYRDTLYNHLMDYARDILPEAAFKAFHSAY